MHEGTNLRSESFNSECPLFFGKAPEVEDEISLICVIETSEPAKSSSVVAVSLPQNDHQHPDSNKDLL